jgi:hypothetical protein
MDLQVLDLDGGIVQQRELLDRYRPEVMAARGWGERLRMACGFWAFRRFEMALPKCSDPRITLYGSGDFHHISLALVRRIRGPFNLLVLDKHPDWMRGVPIMHCGTWLWHALSLHQLKYVFHLGGELDFDNHYRWLAPWRELANGRVRTFPAIRRFSRGRWTNIVNQPLRREPHILVTTVRLEQLLGLSRPELAARPLYISLDKDVMVDGDAVVNWDSGLLRLSEVQVIVDWFVSACEGRLAGMDIVGDWSPVRVQGPLRRALHWTEHPRLTVDPVKASQRNERTNLALLRTVSRGGAVPMAG